jgi:hypothetical protein
LEIAETGDAPESNVVKPPHVLARGWVALNRHLLGRLVVGNAGAAMAGTTLYALFRLGEVATDYLDRLLQISDPSSADFFRFVLSWGGAFAGSSVWLVFTFYQVLDLRSDLKERRR